MVKIFLIILVVINILVISIGSFAQNNNNVSDENRWKNDVNKLWEDMMKSRLEKNNEKELNDKLEKLIEEGKRKKYKISLAETVPIEIQLPGVPEGEHVIGGVDKKEQESKTENKVDADKTKGGVYRGAAILKVSPAYPVEAKHMDVDPTVVVFIVISKEGKVIDAQCKSGDKVFYKAALSAASQWRFYPSVLDGNPVSILGALTFKFQK
jgi:TonB family protein